MSEVSRFLKVKIFMVELFLKARTTPLFPFIVPRHPAWAGMVLWQPGCKVFRGKTSATFMPSSRGDLALNVTQVRHQDKNQTKLSNHFFFFPFKPLVWFGIGKRGQTDIYYFSTEIYSLNASRATVPTLPLRSASAPWPASLPRLTKADWEVALAMCTNSLPGPPHTSEMPSS